MTRFAFRIAVAILVTTMLVFIGMIVTQSPEFQAQQIKRQTEQERIAKINKEVDQRAQRAKLLEKQAKEIELESILNSPAFQEQIAQMILSKQFPGLCGGSPKVARRSDGTIYGQCMGYIYLVDVKAGLAMRIE
jgi:hypothetical protein